jgi:hypothetical protein
MTTKIAKIDRMEFTKLFNFFSFGLEEATVCRELKISKKTFNRWASGVSAPHPTGWDAVYQALLEIVDANNKET